MQALFDNGATRKTTSTLGEASAAMVDRVHRIRSGEVDLDDALNAGDPKLTAQRLHDIRKNLDSRIVYGEHEIQSLSSADKAAQAPLRKARAAVDKILKEKLPGFREADAITAAGKKAQSDVEFGYNSLEGGKTAMFPETFANE